MAINFPATPSTNQTYTFNGRTWTWNGVGWQATGSTGLTVYTKTDFTATAGQTSFSCTYTVGFVDVYYNGSKLSTSEYTATTGSTVVLGTACALNDIVETIAWTISSSFNPSLGSASATSLAIGGATIGSNALAVTGTTALSGLLTAAGGVSSTLTTDATSATTGSIVTAGGISTQKALWVGTTTTLAGALTYGGVTLSNAVTGTGNMVLSASPTFSGSLTVTGTQTNLKMGGNTGNYNFVSLNGSFADGLAIGLVGGATADPSVYLDSGYVSSTPGSVVFRIGGASAHTEAARFDTSGNLCVGSASAPSGCTSAVTASGLAMVKAVTGASVANSGTITLYTGANRVIGYLLVSSVNPANASIRTQATYSVFIFDGDNTSIQQIHTATGSGGGSGYTITYTNSVGFVLTNTSGAARNLYMAVSGCFQS